MKKNVIISLVGFLFAGVTSAATFSMQTRGGKTFSLETDKDRVTGETNSVTVCGEGVESIKKIKLWMPDHGHGSSPVQVGPTEDGCRVVKRVNFTMLGTWEVRVELNDGDSGAFVLEVE